MTYHIPNLGGCWWESRPDWCNEDPGHDGDRQPVETSGESGGTMSAYAEGLRRAATYCQDYIRGEEDRARMQRVLLRFAAVADCDKCDDSGYLRDDAMHPRADHHPMKGVCRMLDVPNTIDCSVMVDLPDAEFEQDDYDGDLFSDFTGGA